MQAEAAITPQQRPAQSSILSDSDSLGLYMNSADVAEFEKEKERQVAEKVQRCLNKKDIFSSEELPEVLGGDTDSRPLAGDKLGVGLLQPSFAKAQTAVDYHEEFPIREGDIYKRGQSMKSWKQRHHVLELTHIDYFDTKSKQKHRGRCHLVYTCPDDLLILEQNDRIAMHILTPTRIWRFHFISRDLRAEWYDDIIARIKALEHFYQKLRKGECSYRKPGRIYASWEDRYLRLDNCFNLYVYSNEDIDSHEFTIDLFIVTELSAYEEGDRNGVTVKIENASYTFVFNSSDLARNWLDEVRAQIELRDELLQFEASINEPASWNVSEHARFFGEFWKLFGANTEFPGFKSLQWGVLGFGEDPMESFAESGVLGFEILRKMSTDYEDELRRIFDKATNYPRLAVCLTTFIRLYKELGQTNHFRRIVCFGGTKDPVENMTEVAFCILKRFDKRWRKHKFGLEHLKDICEEFLEQLIAAVYHSNCLRMLKQTICLKALDRLNVPGPKKRLSAEKISGTKKNSFFGRLTSSKTPKSPRAS